VHERNTQRRLIYYPPSQETIETYVEKVCKAFEQKFGAEYGSKDMQVGLTNFLKLIAKAKVRQLNAEFNKENVV